MSPIGSSPGELESLFDWTAPAPGGAAMDPETAAKRAALIPQAVANHQLKTQRGELAAPPCDVDNGLTEMRANSISQRQVSSHELPPNYRGRRVRSGPGDRG